MGTLERLEDGGKHEGAPQEAAGTWQEPYAHGGGHLKPAPHAPDGPPMSPAKARAVALVTISTLIVAGIFIGVAISPAPAESDARLGLSPAAECAVRDVPALACRNCTCCSNAASGIHATVPCGGCVRCCPDCPNCASLAGDHLDCLEAGGRVVELHSRGRGHFCVPNTFKGVGGAMPEWYDQVLDFNPEWRPCRNPVPSCPQFGCPAQHHRVHD